MAIKSFRTIGFSLLMVFMLAVAACGGDDDDNGDENGNGNGNGGGSTTIEAPGMEFDPAEFTITAGEDHEVTLDNTDGQPHTLVVDEGDFEIEADGGESASGTLNVPDAGEYTFYCSIPGHRESGQEGTLTVE
jgi:cytochrome c oxidase subunit II